MKTSRVLKKNFKLFVLIILFVYLVLIYQPNFNIQINNVSISFIPQEIINHLSASESSPNTVNHELSNMAYVQYATSINYLCQCFLNFIKLRKLNTSIPNLVILYTSKMEEKLPEHFIYYSKEYGIKLKPVPVIHRQSKDSTWSDSFTKFSIWLETDFQRIVFLDSDSIILNSHFDELFYLPKEVKFASPQAYWLSERSLKDNDFMKNEKNQLTMNDNERNLIYDLDNLIQSDSQTIYDRLPVVKYDMKHLNFATHIMVISPSDKIFGKLMSSLNRSNKNDYDMEIINSFFKNKKNSINFNINPLLLPHQTYSLLSGELRSSHHLKFTADPIHLPIVTSKDYKSLTQKNPKFDSGSYWQNWDVNQLMNTTKLVHYSDHPIPKPWNKQNLLEEYNKFKIACPSTSPNWVIQPQIVEDCDAVYWWNWLYEEYAKNYQEICWIEIK